jgi:hypothetical protein
MILEAALALEIQRVNPRLPECTVDRYAQLVVDEAQKRGVDPWVVFALVTVESRWISSAMRYEGDGTCSVGLGQINVRDCASDRVEKLKNPYTNLRVVVGRLGYLQDFCKRDCAGLGWLRGYNPGSRRYVSFVVQAMTAREKYEDRESDVSEVHIEVYSSGMCRQDGP